MTSSITRRLAATALAVVCAAALPATAGASTEQPTDAPAGVCAPDATGTVATDHDKYFNWDTVHISGGGYAAGCELRVDVERPDGTVVRGDRSGTEGGDAVTTADDGTFTLDYLLEDMDGVYVVRVVDAATGTTLATTSFLDWPNLVSLRHDTKQGPTDNRFAPGDVIYAEGKVDAGTRYRYIVRDGNDHIVANSGCSAKVGSPGAQHVPWTWTVPADAPATSWAASTWEFELHQYAGSDSDCDGLHISDQKTFSIEHVIDFPALADKTYGDADVQLAATSNAGLEVDYKLGNGSTGCTLVGTKVRLTGPGTCKVVAYEDGSIFYGPAASVTRSFTIAAKQLTGAVTVANKAYDGTTAATITARNLNGVVAGDTVSLTGGTATFATPNAGANKTVTITGASLTGPAAAKYTLATPVTTTASITAKQVTGAFVVQDKVYDGNVSADIVDRTVTGVLPADDGQVSMVGGAATFADRKVGTGKLVTGNGFELSGAKASNYTLASSTLTTTASITPKQITGAFSAADKTYDGTTTATITGRTVDGEVDGDDVSLTGGTAEFASKDAGTHTVTGTGFTLDGADAGNYELESPTLTTTATIGKRPLEGSFTAEDKVYDGTTDATIDETKLDDVLGTEDVQLTGGTAKFASKTVGKHTVTGTGFVLSGDDAGNYSLDSSELTTEATITSRTVKGSFTAADKVYDGDVDADITGRDLEDEVDGDAVALSGGTAQFAAATVGKHKVTGTGFTLTGDDAANYTLESSDLETEATISAAELTGSFTAENKVYNGQTGATISSRSVDGELPGETVTLEGGTAAFDTPDAGTDKTVTGTGFTLGGADAANYRLASADLTTKADITAREVAGAFTAEDKGYDGTAAATIAGRTLDDAVAGDDVALTGGTAQFADPNVGTDKTVTGTGFVLGGADAGNYALKASTLTTKADIAAFEVTGAFTAADKVEDGTTAATITGRTLTGVLAGDTVTLTGGTAKFADAAVGTGKTVTATGFTLAGEDAANYALAASTLTAKASITAKPVQPAAQPQQQSAPSSVATSIASTSPLTLTGLQVTPSCVTAASLGGKLAKGKTGLILKYRLSRAAQVKVTIARRTPSMARKTCSTVPLGKSKAKYDDVASADLASGTGDNSKRIGVARAAAAPIAHLAVNRQGNPGNNSVDVGKALGGRTLKPGTYRVLAYAVDADGNRSAVARAVFRVVG